MLWTLLPLIAIANMCLIIETRLFCNHTEYETVIVCEEARSGNLGNGPSVAELCQHPELLRVDSTAYCQQCFLDLLEDFRDGARPVCREMLRARCMEWELWNLRRDVEHGRLMEEMWQADR